MNRTLDMMTTTQTSSPSDQNPGMNRTLDMMTTTQTSSPSTSFQIGGDGFVTATVTVRGCEKQARLGQHSGAYAGLWIANDPTGAVTDEIVDECRSWLEGKGYLVEEVPS